MDFLAPSRKHQRRKCVGQCGEIDIGHILSGSLIYTKYLFTLTAKIIGFEENCKKIPENFGEKKFSGKRVSNVLFWLVVEKQNIRKFYKLRTRRTEYKNSTASEVTLASTLYNVRA